MTLQLVGGHSVFLRIPGLRSTGITGNLTLTKTGTTARTVTFPDADIEVQATAEVVQANWQARNHGLYTAIASATVTDPGTPAAGHEFTTLVRNGTLTTSRGAYSVAGTLVQSVWHSGSWTDYPYPHLNGAWTWTAAQTFNLSTTIGTGTGLRNLVINGGNSGINGGASVYLQQGGVTGCAFGNISSILGGAYDGSTAVYTAAGTPIKFYGGSTLYGQFDGSGNLGLGVTPTVTSRLQVQQSGDTSNPGFRILRSSNDSLLQTGYRSGSDSWETSATFSSTGAYKPLTWWTSDLERMRLDTSGNLGIGVTPTAATKLQLGTGQSNGIGFQSGGVVDTYLYRDAANALKTDGQFKFASATGTANALVFGTECFIHRAGANHVRLDLSGTPILEIYTASNTVPVLRFTQNGTSDRCSIGANGSIMEFRHNGGTLNMSMDQTTWGLFGSRTSKQTATGAKGGNAALASVIAALVAYGIINDSTTA